MQLHLRERRLTPFMGPIPRRVSNFADEGLRRSKNMDCFDFVPSNYRVLFGVLNGMPRGRFCEWGSGIGIGIGVAEILGFEAHGIEVNPGMAAASRELLADFGLTATISTASYFDERHNADIYFTYNWPSQMRQVQEHFLHVAPQASHLLICHGAEDIRCIVKVRNP